MTAVLDLATPREAWAWARGVLRAHRRQVGGPTAACFLAATGAGLVGPQLLGALVEELSPPWALDALIDLLALAFGAALLRRNGAAPLRAVAGRCAGRGAARGQPHRPRRPRAGPAAGDGGVGRHGRAALAASTDLDRVDSALRQGVPENPHRGGDGGPHDRRDGGDVAAARAGAAGGGPDGRAPDAVAVAVPARRDDPDARRVGRARVAGARVDGGGAHARRAGARRAPRGR